MLFGVLTQHQGWILKPFAWVMGMILDGIYEFLSLFGIHNVAICIILFTIVTKMLMLPITIKQQKFSKLQSRMSPELTKISEKYKGKKDEASQRKMQAETQEVYDRYGTSPLGGCLPLLITLPIMFALYKVIYMVPAYVGDLYVLYENIVFIVTKIVEATGAQGILKNALENFVDFNRLSNASDAIERIATYDSSSDTFIKSLIDVFTQFNASHWDQFLNGKLMETEGWNDLLKATSQTADSWVSYLKTTIGSDYLKQLATVTDISSLSDLLKLPNLKDTVEWKELGGSIYWNTFSLGTDLKNALLGTDIMKYVNDVLSNNEFIGNMNILDNSGYKFPGICIPILAAGTQIIQSKLTKVETPQKKKSEPESPMAQSLKGMTTIMPVFSGVICILLPIGVGIYWIAGTVVQIIQQIFINRYMNKIDIDEMIAKSVEKSNKKKAKYGVSTNGNRMASVAKTSTKTLEVAKESTPTETKTTSKAAVTSGYKRTTTVTKESSLSDIANLMRDRNMDKTAKKKQEDTDKEDDNNG